MNAIEFLHNLRNAVVAKTGDATAIVRLDADALEGPLTLKLVVIVSGKYWPWTVDASDFQTGQAIIDQCVARITDDPI